MTKQLTEITYNKETKQYTLRFVITSSIETTYALTERTVNMIGKTVATGKTIAHKATSVKEEVITQDVCSLVAKTLARVLQLQGTKLTTEDFGKDLVLRVG